jgi:DNA repair exonuclease SbcCD ATPase subunit
MPNRIPSFIVAGLVLTMFLLGFFYMSCSSTTSELRQALGEFEDRVRSLTMKNSDYEKKFETLQTNKRELEEEKLNLQKQLEKKNSELNELSTKFNEKLTKLHNLTSERQILENRLNELKTINDSLTSKNSEIERIQEDFNQEKEYNEQQLNKLRRKVYQLKQRLYQAQNNEQNVPINSNQRFSPLLAANETIPSSSSLALQPLVNRINNTQPFDQNLADQRLNISDIQQRFKRSRSDILSVSKPSNETNINNKIQFNTGTTQTAGNVTTISYSNETKAANNQSQLLVDNQNNLKKV